MRKLFELVLTALVFLMATAATAQTTPGGPAADAALVERIRDAVIKELRASGAMDQAVDAGIERFVERQNALAQEAERREANARAGGVARPVARGRDHIRGDPAAPVSLIEYSDFECPFCKGFHSTVKRLVAESKGQLKWVYRHFPLEELHPAKARKEAVASECAAEIGGNEAFWKFADRFFELTPSHNRTDIDSVLPQIAAEIGVDKAKFASCLASKRHDRRIAEDIQEAIATGGRGTPWSLVVSRSGKVYPLSGAQPYAATRQLIEMAFENK